MQHVAYYRVSTLQQGESGLGLAAQKDVVLRFIGNEPLLAEFTEIESGRRHKNRPQLLAALELCKKKKARLVIAKLDRLSRNVAFISSLMESGVDFVCCDNPHANRLMLHLLAAFAEHEREIISQRIKAAFGRIKADLALNGSRISKSGRVYTKLGSPNLEQARIKAASLKRALRPPEYALRLMSQMRDEGNVLRAIAAALNNMEIRTPQGFHWYASTVRSTIARIHEITKGRKDANTMGGNNEIAPSSKSRLPEVFCPDTSATRASNAQALFAGGDMSLEEAKRMIEVFTSVGARSFLLTQLDLMQQKI
jgi:DNA invertase Pin-like site-specific DNA recombinase